MRLIGSYCEVLFALYSLVLKLGHDFYEFLSLQLYGHSRKILQNGQK